MTQIFAHRGYAALFAENTMTSFQEAEKAGANGIELDVQLTKDGELVVIHDEKVNRTTNGTGYVKDFTYKEIRQFNAAYLIKGKAEPIPSLVEVLEWLQTNQLICNIEFKNGIFPYEGMESKTIRLVQDYGLTNRIIFSSFNHESIVTSYRIAPEIETAPLYSNRIFMPWIYATSIHAKGIHPNYRGLTDEIIANCLANGIAVRPYTVNKEVHIERLMKAQCTAVITDDPAKALIFKKRYEKRP